MRRDAKEHRKGSGSGRAVSGIAASRPAFAADARRLPVKTGARSPSYSHAEGRTEATTSAASNLSAIYRPISEQLEEVEYRLGQVIAAAPPQMEEMLKHALKAGGKRIRPALTLLAGKLHRSNAELLVPVAAAVELLHTATLIHDDTIDDSDVRRGRATAHRLWGDTSAVLLGDYLCAAASRMVAETGRLWFASARRARQPRSVRTMEMLAQTIMDICSGAIEESLDPSNLNMDSYLRRIGNKTASLFTAAAESGAVLSEAPEMAVRSLRDYGYNLGMGFQIVDDLLDLADDLGRGKFSLPVISFFERPENARAMRLLDAENGDRKQLADMVRASSAYDECRRTARDFCSRACLALEKLPHGPAHESLIELSTYIAERNE